MRYLSLFMFALLTACTGCNHSGVPYRYIAAHETATPHAKKVIAICVDDHFGEADRVAIDDALGQWNYALNGYIRLEVRDWHYAVGAHGMPSHGADGVWVFVRLNSLDYAVPDGDGDKKVVAWARDDESTRMYMIRDRLSNENFGPVVLHEIGHLLGAEHTSSGIMVPVYEESAPHCLDRAVIAQVAALHHLRMENLSWCDYGEAPVETPVVHTPPPAPAPSADPLADPLTP